MYQLYSYYFLPCLPMTYFYYPLIGRTVSLSSISSHSSSTITLSTAYDFKNWTDQRTKKKKKVGFQFSLVLTFLLLLFFFFTILTSFLSIFLVLTGPKALIGGYTLTQIPLLKRSKMKANTCLCEIIVVQHFRYRFCFRHHGI